MSRRSKGRSFEKAVAAVQGLMAPKATVEHNVRLLNKLGHRRQFDVVIRTKAAGHEILGVIECKDWERRVGTPEVEGFAKKAESVNANLRLLVSKRGFTKPAIEAAKDCGMGMLSLLPDDPQDCGFSIGAQWYAVVYRWQKSRISIHSVSESARMEGFGPDQVTWTGKRIVDWFHKELVTTYLQEQREGWFSVTVQFDKRRRLRVSGRPCLAAGVTFHALRTRELKTRWVALAGHAFYDWGKSSVAIPPKAQVASEGIRTDLSDWEDYDGEIPPAHGLLDARITAYMRHFDPDREVVDLGSL